MQKVSVVGAGTMGNGIAHVIALHHLNVHLIDTDPNALEKAIATITKNLDRQVQKGTITQDQKALTIQAISTFTSIEEGVKEADLVIEAATENKVIKKQIFSTMDQFAPAHCILASNTSSIPIHELAAVTKRPEKVIGMHFMNPVPIMKLVEIINASQTNNDTTNQIVALTEKLEKVPCVVKDFPGFISNRILMPMINEAIIALSEGVSDAATIDKIMKLGMAHPMGPLQLADYIGLDVCKYILDVLYEGFQNEKYKPATLLVEMVHQGTIGVKSGKGFFNYNH
jgi:3-hydroxybutyryl-CoA dehydrogenase